MTIALSSGITGQSHLQIEDKKKWPSAQDCRGMWNTVIKCGKTYYIDNY